MTETRYTAHPLYSINCRAMEACILFFLGQIESCPCIYNLHTQTSKNFFLTCTSAPESTLTTLCSFLLLWIQVNHWHYPDGCRVFPANLCHQTNPLYQFYQQAPLHQIEKEAPITALVLLFQRKQTWFIVCVPGKKNRSLVYSTNIATIQRISTGTLQVLVIRIKQ